MLATYTDQFQCTEYEYQFEAFFYSTLAKSKIRMHNTFYVILAINGICQYELCRQWNKFKVSPVPHLS